MAASQAPARDGRILRAERIRAERRKQVLDCARRVFAERGYHETSIDDLIRDAGIARGTFYLYFPSKRALFEELLDTFLVELRSAIRPIEVDGPVPPPVVQLQENVVRLLASLEDHRHMTRILLREAAGLDDEFDRKLRDFYDQLHGLIKGGLELGISMGLIRSCDPDIVGRCVLGSIREVVASVILPPQGDAGRLPTTPRDVLAREIVSYLVWGTFRPG